MRAPTADGKCNPLKHPVSNQIPGLAVDTVVAAMADRYLAGSLTCLSFILQKSPTDE